MRRMRRRAAVVGRDKPLGWETNLVRDGNLDLGPSEDRDPPRRSFHAGAVSRGPDGIGAAELVER